MEKDCLIIKKKEYNELLHEIDSLKDKHAQEVKQLKKEIEEEKNIKKSDEVNITVHLLRSYFGREKEDIVSVKLNNTLPLSMGISRQIRKILRIVEEKVKQAYDIKLNQYKYDREKSETDIKIKNKQILIDSFNNGMLYKRSTIIDKIQKVL